ncbi:MAG: hypothetical protein WAV20_20565 [Blastocatellia bacterium]
MATFTILEPMSTGDVIDRAVRLYRRNFIPLVAITAVPTLIGYVVSLMFWYGYTSLLTGAVNSRGLPVTAIWMLAIGGLGYPVWAYALLLTVSGVSRLVGDHLMLGEPITFRRCLAAIRRRLGAITLMGLLSIALLLAVYVLIGFVLLFLILIVGLIVGAIAAARLPQWMATVVLSITVIVSVAVALFLICVVVARLVFLPQVVMIEGESAGNALGRAIRLGKGNWYRVAGIGLFTYFVSLSMLAALTLPVLVALYMYGILTPEFFVSPTWSILYTSFRDISGLLSLPIWIVSFTLLYFDSRVRKEAYDVDLLAREINPGFYWHAVVQPTVPAATARSYVQTSPLGLAGFIPSNSGVGTAERVELDSAPEDFRAKFERAAENPGTRTNLETGESEATPADPPGPPNHLTEDAVLTCQSCGGEVVRGARFCMRCGTATPPS